VGNTHIRSLRPLSAAMSAPRDSTLAGRPIASLTFALNYALTRAEVRNALTPVRGGLPDRRFLENVRGYHAVNLTIHLIAGLALFGIVRRTLLTARLHDTFGAAATGLALSIAAIWIVHPLQTSSVTYVVQRVEVLMGMFYLLTLYCAIRAAGAPTGEPQRAGLSRGREASAAPTGERSEPACTGERQRAGPYRGSEASAAPVWWSVAAVVSCALGMGSKEVMATAPIVVILWDVVFNRDAMVRRRGLYAALCATWMILAVLVAGGPRSLSVGFGFAEWPWWRYLLAQSAIVLHYLRLALVPWPLVLDYSWMPPASVRDVVLPFAAISALVALTAWGLRRRSPAAFAGACVFIILAPTSSVLPIVTEVAAEHRMYLPLAPVVALAVAGAFLGLRRAAGTPQSSRAAVRAGATAVALVVAVSVVMTRARNADYHAYERIWSDTIAKRPRNARAQNNYAASLVADGRFAEAEAHLRIAVDADPMFAEAQANLGVALSAQSQFDEGIAHLKRAIAIRPDYAAAYRNLGEAYAAQGRLGEAAAQYLRGAEVQPDAVEILNRAAWILATATDDDLRNGGKALELAERAVRLTNRQDVISLDSLGAALAEVGRFETAVETTGEALSLARQQNDRAVVPELEYRLTLYHAGKPFRQPPP
jgi:Tfp pilus assembly protein PilF